MNADIYISWLLFKFCNFESLFYLVFGQKLNHIADKVLNLSLNLTSFNKKNASNNLFDTLPPALYVWVKEIGLSKSDLLSEGG